MYVQMYVCFIYAHGTHTLTAAVAPLLSYVVESCVSCVQDDMIS